MSAPWFADEAQAPEPPAAVPEDGLGITLVKIWLMLCLIVVDITLLLASTFAPGTAILISVMLEDLRAWVGSGRS